MPDLECTRVATLGSGAYSVVYKAVARRGTEGHMKERPVPTGEPMVKGQPSVEKMSSSEDQEGPTPIPESRGEEYVAVKRNLVYQEISFTGSIKEMDLLNKLNGHPHIVKLIQVNYGSVFSSRSRALTPPRDKDYKEDKLHFVMECADFTLKSAISDSNLLVLTPTIQKSLITQMLLAVECLHHHDIIHRDIKPDNLLLFRDDKDVRLKICDFGLAKLYDRRECQSPGVVTVTYRAPEVCLGVVDYTEAIDVWSLGCIIYEIITFENFIVADFHDDDATIINNLLATVPDKNSKSSIINMLNKRDIQLVSPNYASNVSIEPSDKIKSVLNKQFNPLAPYGPWQRFLRMNPFGPEFANLVKNMLSVNPDKRPNVTQILDMDIFKDQMDMINASRNVMTNINTVTNSQVILSDKKLIEERQLVLKVAFDLMQNNHNQYLKYWFKPRIIYQSIDIYERWLHFPQRNDDKFKLFNSEVNNIIICFKVCVYLAMKLFHSVYTLNSFHIFFPEHSSPLAIQFAEQWEYILLSDVLKFQIYRESYFEQIPNDQARANLVNFLNHIPPSSHSSSISLARMFQLYCLSQELFEEREWGEGKEDSQLSIL